MNYKALARHYERCLELHGDTFRGVDWPNSEDAIVRYQVMMGVIRPLNDHRSKPTLLDFGCGAGHLLEFIQKNYPLSFRYSGVDISEKYITLCKSKFPNGSFFVLDLMAQELPQKYDYIIANGVFTEKLSLPFNEMMQWAFAMISRLFWASNIGIAFNVMSTHVTKQREDLFHVPVEKLIEFLVTNLSRNFLIKNDYGLYEYTVYLYHNASNKTSYNCRK